MEVGAKIYNHLDEERKFMGFTALEIIISLISMVMGFVLNMVVEGVVCCFISVPMIRYIKHLLKISRFKRLLFFFFSDLVFSSKKSINCFAKYYL